MIVPGNYEGSLLWGFTKYDLPNESSTEERCRLGFSAWVRGTVHRLKREIGNDEDDLLSLVDNEDKEH